MSEKRATPEEIPATPLAKATVNAIFGDTYYGPGKMLDDGQGGITVRHALPDGATSSIEISADGSFKVWIYQRPCPFRLFGVEFALGAAIRHYRWETTNDC